MASAGIVSRDPWIEMMEKTLLDVFTAGLEGENEWKRVWTEKKSTKRREEVVEFSRPDVVVETPEGAPYVELRSEKIRTAAAVHTDYTGMIRITHQMIRDKQYDQMEEESWGLGESINRKLYELSVQQFHQGFSQVTGPDALSWFNTAHVCANSTLQTWSNQYTGGSLDPDAFNSARVLLMKTLNENGKITPCGTGKVQLIVPADLDRLSKQLAMPGQYEPGKAEFNVNVFDIEPITLPMLGMADSTYAATQFYIRDPKRAKNLYLIREGPLFDMFKDPQTDAVIVKARIACSFLIASARGVVGSKGV
jgi:hypothetical protein